MQRRTFLTCVTGAVLFGSKAAQSHSAKEAKKPSQQAEQLASRPPRWRGFNLLEKFNMHNQRPFVEQDFEWIAEWGFDFVRLPMDYRCWTDPQNPYRLNEAVLKEIDQAVHWGQQYGVHVSLNLHRAPGYTVARPPEKLNLWTDSEAQKQFVFQWRQFAERYKGISPAQLSFNLVNEPSNIPAEQYARVVRQAVEAIRDVDPNRLIICDGLQWARTPVAELVPLKVIQSTRGYDPMRVSHYKASWVHGDRWAEPTWPLREGNRIYDRNWLYETRIKPWKELEAKGCGVHVGECGAYNKTPHQVVLAWLEDFLSLWKEAGWGWALWNLRGSFGILDSERADVKYENFHGHKLDRKLLELLRRY